MGDNTLSAVSEGSISSVDQLDQYRTALNNDHVPRNASGAATDEGGSIGTSALRWLKGWFTSIGIGASSSNNTIEENVSNDVIIKRNGSTVATFTANGLSESNINPAIAGDGLGVSSGVLSVNVDNSTLETNADTVRIKDLGVTSAKIANGAVSTAQLGSGGITPVKVSNRNTTTTATTSSNQTAYRAATVAASNSVTVTLATQNANCVVLYGFRITANAGASSGNHEIKDDVANVYNVSIPFGNAKQGTGSVMVNSPTTITVTYANNTNASSTVEFWAYELI